MKDKKILIVDDEPDNLKVLAEMLEEQFSDSRIIQTNNAISALAIALKITPDIIITDWNMPNKTGLDLIIDIKKEDSLKDIPIIMATGIMLSSEDMRAAFDAGANDYIRKPFNKIELSVRVNSVIKTAEYQNQIIENSNRELAENTLSLIKNNEFNASVIKKLSNFKEELTNNGCKIHEKIDEIITEIDDKVRVDSWQKFQLVFETTHKDFTQNLLSQFPKLTTSEIKLAIFLKLGMNTKDIASALYQTPESIKVSRSRLRKKLQLTTEQNLQAFLSSF